MTKIHDQNFKLGILGGGQLGRMLIQEAINFDIDLYIMDDSQDSPCAKYAAHYKIGSRTCGPVGDNDTACLR